MPYLISTITPCPPDHSNDDQASYQPGQVSLQSNIPCLPSGTMEPRPRAKLADQSRPTPNSYETRARHRQTDRPGSLHILIERQYPQGQCRPPPLLPPCSRMAHEYSRKTKTDLGLSVCGHNHSHQLDISFIPFMVQTGPKAVCS